MKSIVFVAPIIPGQLQNAKRLFKEVSDARASEQAASLRTLRITRQTCWIQETRIGNMLIVLLEGDDPAKSTQEFASSKAPFDMWFKEQVELITGVNFSNTVPQVERVYDWRAG